MRARILESMGEARAGQTQVSAAIRLFADHGLADHPNVSELRRIERELE